MSHYSVLVITKEDETIESKLYPFWELDLTPEEMKNDPRAEFQVTVKKEDVEKSAFEIIEKLHSWKDKYSKDFDKASSADNECFDDVIKDLNMRVNSWDLSRIIKESDTPYVHFNDLNNEEKLFYLKELISMRVKEQEDLIKKYSKLLEDKNFSKLFDEWEGTTFNEDGDIGYYHNPNKKWDWYKEGGRWPGKLLTKDGNKVNSCLVKDISENCLRNLHTWSILDKDGNWNEKGKMGWWGMWAPEEVHMDIPRTIQDDIFKDYSEDEWCGEEYRNKIKSFVHKYYDNVGDCWERNSVEFDKDDGLFDKEFVATVSWNYYYFEKFLKDLDPEDRLTVVDCHI